MEGKVKEPGNNYLAATEEQKALREYMDIRFEETNKHIEIRSKGTNRYMAFATAAILAGMTILGTLLNTIIQQ